MPTIELGCRLVYYVEFETSFVFQLSALESSRQRIGQESFSVESHENIRVHCEQPAGQRLHRLQATPGWLNVYYQASVQSNPREVDGTTLALCEHADLPAEVLVYLNPSRYCESDQLESFAWRTFGNSGGGYRTVRHVIDWVFQHLDYVPGSTVSGTSARDVFLQRRGVCRDYAHLSIALCRALGLPARYVAVYAVELEPPDFHGLMEVYLDDDWYLFDATRLAPLEGFVRIGIGRDAADLSFATFVGNSVLNEMHVWARTEDALHVSDQARSLISLG